MNPETKIDKKRLKRMTKKVIDIYIEMTFWTTVLVSTIIFLLAIYWLLTAGQIR